MLKKTAQPTYPILEKLKGNLPTLTLLLIGAVVGVLWFGALRLLLHHNDEIHYHSNFAVFVDGERQEFQSFTYYEEVAACTTAFADNPKGRGHMHDQVNDVIHVHDNAVTYGDFFTNLDWGIGPNYVRTDKGLLVNDADKIWVFILNGDRVARVDNRVIDDQDKLLISYGTANTDIMGQYNKIENKAETHDNENDPATCSGLNGPLDNSFPTRLKKAFNFSN